MGGWWMECVLKRIHGDGAWAYAFLFLWLCFMVEDDATIMIPWLFSEGLVNWWPREAVDLPELKLLWNLSTLLCCYMWLRAFVRPSQRGLPFYILNSVGVDLDVLTVEGEYWNASSYPFPLVFTSSSSLNLAIKIYNNFTRAVFLEPSSSWGDDEKSSLRSYSWFFYSFEWWLPHPWVERSNALFNSCKYFFFISHYSWKVLRLVALWWDVYLLVGVRIGV